MSNDNENLKLKDLEYWRAKLTPEQFYVTRQGGTERPFTGKYNGYKTPGDYHCSNCRSLLFTAETKYDSGSGWPSFWQAVEESALVLISDTTHGMERIEVRCASCDAHLGHVFDDGPQPTGQRYCINSASILHSEDLKEAPKTSSSLRDDDLFGTKELNAPSQQPIRDVSRCQK